MVPNSPKRPQSPKRPLSILIGASFQLGLRLSLCRRAQPELVSGLIGVLPYRVVREERGTRWPRGAARTTTP